MSWGVEVAELLSTPTKNKPKDDRLASVLRGVSAATRRRVIRVAEALVETQHILAAQRHADRSAAL